MSLPKRVLILTADVGFGHRSAANAIAAALTETYGDRVRVEINNPMEDERVPAFLRESGSDYDRLVREMPEIYKLRYQFSDTTIPNTIMESAITVMFYRVLQDIMQRYQPDVVVSTHPMYPAPLSAVIATSKHNTPFFTIVTDMGQVHRMWFNPATDLCLVQNRIVAEIAEENKIPPERIQITGIPVDPRLARRVSDKRALRVELGWEPDHTTALVVGSKRVKNLEQALYVLNHAGWPLQLVIVAGGDDALYAQLQKTEWHVPVRLYNFVNNMPDLMLASDFIVGKAGGLIVTESLAAGLPLLLVDVTPGQEEGNAEWVLEQGAGDLAEDPLRILEVLCHWLAHDGEVLRQRAKVTQGLGKPRAAYTVAEFIWAAAERGPRPLSEATLKGMPKLIDMLSRFGLVGEGAPAGDEPQPA